MASQFPNDRPPATPPSPAGGLVARVQRTLLQPKDERLRLDGEATTLQALYTGWIVPLAAIGPVAALIRTLAFPVTFFGVTVRTAPAAAIGNAIVQFVMALVMVFVLSLIVDALAPNFGGRKDQVQATKVVAFASTPGWVAGVFQIIPSLGLVGLLGLLAALYGLYLLWLALPVLMKAPDDKALPYVAVTIVVTIVLFFVVGALAGVGAALFAPAVPSYGSVTVG